MNVRTPLLLTLAAFLMALPASAQLRHITAAKAPAFLFADSATNRVHLLTAGVDANFDGVFQPDSGDEAPRWLVFDGTTDRIVDSLDFPGFFNSFPIRPGIDWANHLIYLPQLGRVRAFDVRTMKLVRDTVIPGFFAAVSYDPFAKHLLLAERPGFTDPGYVWILDSTALDTIARVRTGVNPSMSIAQRIDSNVSATFTLSEGQFGKGNATITSVMAQRDLFARFNDSVMGGGANWLEVHGDRAYILLLGPHQLHILDTKTNKDLPFSPINFSGIRQNGPRVLAFRGDSVALMGTYNGEIFFIDTQTGATLDTAHMRGRVESIAVRDSLAFVAIRTDLVVGVPDSVMQVVNLNTRKVVQTLPLAREPMAVFLAANGDVHLIANGLGERIWLTLDATTLAVKRSRTFTGTLNNPFRFVYDAAQDTLYAIFGDTLRAASGSSPTVAWKTVYAVAHPSGELFCVSRCDPYLVVSEGTSTSVAAEYFHFVDRSGNLIARFHSSARPFLAAPIPSTRPGAFRCYGLCRGPSGAQISQLDIFEFTPNIVSPDSLGDGANHILSLDTIGVVTLNGSNALAAVHLPTGAVLRRVPVGTTGFNGPRETLVMPDGRAVVTTYNGDVRVLNNSGEMKPYATHGKAEGVTVLGNKVYVADVFNGDYSADSMVTVFDAITLVASVERTAAVAHDLEQCVPNPAGEATTIRFSVSGPGRVRLTLHSLRGEQMATLVDRDMEAGSYSATVALGALPSGSYLYRLTTPTTVQTRTMQVVR